MRIEREERHKMEDRALRSEGFGAIRVRGELRHPECRTEEERRWTVMFVRDDDVDCLQGQRCGACNGMIAPWL